MGDRKRLAKVVQERDAYRKAKQENDERFMREREEARVERDAALSKLSASDALLRRWLDPADMDEATERDTRAHLGENRSAGATGVDTTGADVTQGPEAPAARHDEQPGGPAAPLPPTLLATWAASCPCDCEACGTLAEAAGLGPAATCTCPPPERDAGTCPACVRAAAIQASDGMDNGAEDFTHWQRASPGASGGDHRCAYNGCETGEHCGLYAAPAPSGGERQSWRGDPETWAKALAAAEYEVAHAGNEHAVIARLKQEYEWTRAALDGGGE